MQIILTEDGSHTLYVPEINESYHSIHGAIQESLHVFVEAGLNHCVKNNIRVLEVGFGTGLNAFLTCLASKNKHIDYVGIEKNPLPEECRKSLNYGNFYGDAADIFEKIHAAEWGPPFPITANFTLCKLQGDFLSLPLPDKYDVIFYDAFSPEKQPELWTETAFQKLFNHSSNGGIATTYCAKGAVRRAMQAAGYTVERLAGFNGKREMLRMIKEVQ